MGARLALRPDRARRRCRGTMAASFDSSSRAVPDWGGSWWVAEHASRLNEHENRID
jgi:hypothetical protein